MERRIVIAPMIDITNRFFRYFMRLLTRKATLYTEMIVDHLALHNHGILDFSEVEHPIVAQIGGREPETTSSAAVLLEQLGYDEINLNCGCPSTKIKSGAFGACLMLDPGRVSTICTAIKSRVSIPVSVKCRLGVDDNDTYGEIVNFTEHVKASGVCDIIYHARKAFLRGLNPSQNRTVPPLNYEWVYSLREEFPEMRVAINGGVQTHSDIAGHFNRGVDSVMIGRLAYNNPWFFHNIDSLYYHEEDPSFSRLEILEDYGEYCDLIQARERPLNHCYLAKPLTNLFHGERNNSHFRSELDKACKEKKSWEFKPVVDHLISFMQENNPEALTEVPAAS